MRYVSLLIGRAFYRRMKMRLEKEIRKEVQRNSPKSNWRRSKKTVRLIQIKLTEEKLDLRTAASLLTRLGGTDDATIQPIDAIELSELLSGLDRPLLNSYVLKTPLNQTAKLRIS